MATGSIHWHKDPIYIWTNEWYLNYNFFFVFFTILIHVFTCDHKLQVPADFLFILKPNSKAFKG